MKKILLLIAVLMVSASYNTVSAQKKKNKKEVQQVTQTAAPRVSLTTPSDTLSYAAGAAISGGLDQFLAQQFGLQSADMPEFLRGLKDALSRRKDATFKAYSAGYAIAEQITSKMLPNLESQLSSSGVAINEDIVLKGFVAALEKDSSIFTQDKASQYFEAKREAIKEAKDAAIKAENEKFMADNAKKEGVITTPSGLQYKIEKKGTGAIPTKDDKVKVVYEGRTIDGKVFDATANHGTDSDTFGVGNLIKGWTEALTMMPVGSVWTLYIPQELAYGARGAGKEIAPYSALIFTLELKDIVKDEAPTSVSAAPGQVKSVPAKKLTPAKKVRKK